MKIRNGFVSNSSSSSFVVNRKTDTPKKDIPRDLLKIKGEDYTITLPTKKGTYSFGWEEKRWKDVPAKMNYAVIQAMNSEKMWEYLYRIEEAIEAEFKENHPNDDIYVYWDYNAVFYGSETQYAEIDHQSSIREDNDDWRRRTGKMPIVHDIFDSVDNMRNFLFNQDAYIQGGNDNGGNDSEDYRESEEYLYGKIFNIHNDRDNSVYELDDYSHLTPLYEGTCKVCGQPMEYRSFSQDYHDIPKKEGVNHWDYIRDMVNVPHGDNDPWYDGYYICSNPDCECHKKVYPVTEYNAKDADVIDRYKEFC